MAEYKGDGIISIEADIKEAQEYLTMLGMNKKTINKALLRAAGTGGRQAIRKNYKTVLNKRSGNLYKGITSYVKRDGTEVVFTDNVNSGKRTAKDGRIARYGFMLASGYAIKPLHGKKTLMFEYQGRKYFPKEVHVDAIDWVEAPINRYAGSLDLQSRLDKAFEKQLAKWEKKNGGTAS